MRCHSRVLLPVLLAVLLSGCLGTVVGTTADVTIEAAKIPFKVAGAVVDVASGDGGDEDE